MRNYEATVTVALPKGKADITAFEGTLFHGFTRDGVTFTYANPHLNDVRIRAVDLIQALQAGHIKVSHYRLVEIIADSTLYDFLGLLPQPRGSLG